MAYKDYKFSPESRKKMSVARMGRKWNSEEREKLMIARAKTRGVPRSKEVIEKIKAGKKKWMESPDCVPQIAWNKGLKGYKMPPANEERKKKISIANTGIKRTPEVVEKYKARMIRSPLNYWLGKNRPDLAERFRGSGGSNWKGGMTPLINLIRHCFKYRQWRCDIFQRDDYTCQKCEKRGGELNVHHKDKTFTEIFYINKIRSLDDAFKCEEFWNINNGETLCVSCHRKTETWGPISKEKKSLWQKV